MALSLYLEYGNMLLVIIGAPTVVKKKHHRSGSEPNYMGLYLWTLPFFLPPAVEPSCGRRD